MLLYHSLSDLNSLKGNDMKFNILRRLDFEHSEIKFRARIDWSTVKKKKKKKN